MPLPRERGACSECRQDCALTTKGLVWRHNFPRCAGSLLPPVDLSARARIDELERDVARLTDVRAEVERLREEARRYRAATEHLRTAMGHMLEASRLEAKAHKHRLEAERLRWDADQKLRELVHA